MSGRNRPTVSQFFQEKQAKHPNLVEWWSLFEESYNKKFWHQLTTKINDFVRLPEAKKTDLVSLYNNFIADFETKMNPLSLVEIVSLISEQINNYEERINLIKNIKNKVKSNQDASILCSILIGQLRIKHQDYRGVKEVLDEIGPLIDEETGVTPVHGRYFQLSSDYHQLMGNHDEYYRNALRFLGCSEQGLPKDESNEVLEQRAFTLALSALLGSTIFNFGELLQHPIIEHLRRTKPWLVELLHAFNAGDIRKFEALKSSWSSQADLASRAMQLREKISLLCLMEMTFKSSSGMLTFRDISQTANLPLTDVELVVMKALSLGLIRGTIDEVDQVVNLHWVQPRVLDKTQIHSLATKLDTWCKGVNQIEKLVEAKAQDIIG